MADVRHEIADTIRGRILRGLSARSLQPGDRLPAARELRDEFGGVDHRIVLDAYRLLEKDGLVELRARGGVYVAKPSSHGPVPLPSASWLTGICMQAVAREIPLGELHAWLRRGMCTRRLRAIAVQGTVDQIAGLCRELSDDYGLEVKAMSVAALAHRGRVTAELRHADLVVTTAGFEAETRRVAEEHGKPVIVVDIRPDFIGGEWRLLLRRPVYVVVCDEKAAEKLKLLLEDTPGAENIRPIVLGRDSLNAIPDDALVYVTRSAREALGKTPVRGRLLPSGRLLSSSSSAQLIRFIIDANLRALAGA